ncbi:DEAD-box ATP-dependent RNA helicase 21 [Tanacetum coccineum]|uniref:RNA helicase n=1 Tax=Tanacetum coccineum TaxID=301880 RepID=A0ABQ4ZZ87_9ASTR
MAVIKALYKRQVVGFGVCPRTNDPKLVKISVVKKPSIMWVVEVSIDGVIYWRAYDDEELDDGISYEKLMEAILTMKDVNQTQWIIIVNGWLLLIDLHKLASMFAGRSGEVGLANSPRREALALKRRQEEFEEQKRRQEQLLNQSNPNSSSSSSKQPSDDVTLDRDRRDRDRDRDRRDRDREREEESKLREKDKLEKQAERDREKELDRDMNALYQNPHKARLLFGRGFRAGMDRREQKKLAAKNEKDLRDEIRKKDGVEERPEDLAAQRVKDEAAERYDTFDMRVDRHWSDKKLEEMTERDWRIFREDFNISWVLWTPSPIQMAAIPLGLQQRDVIGVAETGSGKIAAFVLPMLTYITRLPPISEENEAESPYAVVLAPTRELAQQIEEETVKFAHYLGIKVVSIVGGQSIEEQGFKIRQGCEVDRMIDMGFEPQIMDVLEAMPSSNFKPENEDEELDEKRIYRTTYIFSATMPTAVERLARKYLRNPVVVTIGTAGKATDLITQHVIMVKESVKMPRLQKLLDDLGDKTAIVFINTKKTTDFVSKTLEKSGYRVTTLHGGKSQEKREVSLDGFRTKRFNVLVATDVAGRGIDIPDVAHVINYDMPGNIEQYTHRIGRTGRAGKTGTATTFLTLQDSDVFYDLKQMLTQNQCSVPPELARHEASKFKPGSIPDRPPRRNDTVFAH